MSFRDALSQRYILNYIVISNDYEYTGKWHSLCSELSKYADGITSEAKDDAFSFSGEDGRGDIRPVSRMQEALQASWSSVVQG